MRPFRPKVLQRHAGPELRPRLQSGETVNRFTITVPLQEVIPSNRVSLTDCSLRLCFFLATRLLIGWLTIVEEAFHG